MMKNSRLMMAILMCGVLCFVFTSCKDSPTEPGEVEQPPITELEIADDFSFSTLQKINLLIDVQSSDGNPIQNIRVEVSDRPFPGTGKNGLLGDRYSGADGRCNFDFNINTEIEKLYVRTDLVGVRNYAELIINGQQLQHRFRIESQTSIDLSGKRNEVPQIDASHFEEPRNTGANMSLMIRDITGIDIVDGAELACITPAGLIAGVETLNGPSPYGLAVWGDDFTSDEIDGFRAGEDLTFLYWDPPRKEEIAAEASSVDGSLTYSTNGFAVIDLLVEPQGRFRFLGNWDTDGVPDYLETGSDQFDSDFFKRIAANFPEGLNINETHPDFIQQNTSIHISDEADIWVGFLHNGSSNNNPFGFYSYSGDEIPQNPRELGELKIIFPNPSIAENGSGLNPGNKVHLGQFEANTTIGWFILSNGWQQNQIVAGDDVFYSTSDLNPELSGADRPHSMLFLDADTDKLILGFEDKRRNLVIDHDFNDVMMAISVSPSNAFESDDIPILESSAQLADNDLDNVPDALDHWPNDPNSCFGIYFPSWAQNFTFAFEDNWPGIGDYDFNDLVINGNFKQIFNSTGFITSISSSILIQAAGSDKHNGFGFAMNVAPNNVQSVSGTHISGNYITLTGTGIEAGQDNTVIIVFDDVLSLASPAAGFNLVNTEPESPDVSPERLNVTVKFSLPVSAPDLGSAPFNPFLIVDGQRSHEVHLADNPPTSLADISLFGTSEDNSTPESGRFYKSQYNLPWALIVPDSWQHTNESIAINQAYPAFGSWAESSGGASQGWFNTNINTDHIWSGR
ncbi:MAG: LruC domain-containing protein [Calditrichaeota bacterium]|nr:LruC domain-containing protein [Calditrichota bacterium]